MDELPFATPYPWDPSEAPQQLPQRNTPKIGAGFAKLHKQLFYSENTSEAARSALLELLQEHDVELPDTVAYDSLETLASHVKHKRKLWSEQDEETTLQLAREGRFTFLGSILRAVERTPSASTRHIIRTCSLTLRSGDVPASMDAKDMVLAALHFMSSATATSNTTSETETLDLLPALPLIRPVQDIGDLEKCNYVKVGDWSLQSYLDEEGEDEDEEGDSFLLKIQNLELVFMSSAESWKWLGREHFGPPRDFLSQDEETLLMLKGTVPTSAVGKRAKATATGEAAKRRKLAAASPAPTMEDSVATSVDVVVEATPVEDENLQVTEAIPIESTSNFGEDDMI